MEVEERIRKPWRWPLLVAVIALNVCLPSLVLCYGTLLVHSVSHGLPTWLGLATPTIYLLSYCLSQCWCREAADSWGESAGHRVMAALGLVLVASGLLLCAFLPYRLQPILYGGLGGVGSSVISAQVDAVVFDTYDTRLGVVRGLCFVGQAIGQASFPHLILALVDYYGYSLAYLVLSAIVIQMLPAIMFLKLSETVRGRVSHSRYSDLSKSYAIFNNDVAVRSYNTNELQLHDFSKSWKSPDSHSSEENIELDERDSDSENITTTTPPPSPEEKRRNMFGVEILPEIPEVSEDSDDDTNVNKFRLSAAIKRLSILGDNLDQFIGRPIRRDSKPDSNQTVKYSELEITYETIAPMTEIRREKVFNSFSFRCKSAYSSMRRKFWMPSYRVYRLRRRLKYMCYAFNDTFIKPLKRSLSCWRFYPVLLLAFTRLSLIAVSLALLPLINLQIQPKISMVETNFMISMHGFTWICFLLSTPWLVETNRRNYKYVLVAGLFISTASCYAITEAKTHDAFCIGCVVAGLGFGAITSCWEVAAKDFVGAHKWQKVHSTLEILSGISVAGFVFGLSYFIDVEEPGALNLVMLILSGTLTVVSIIWLAIAMISLLLSNIRSYRVKHTWRF